MTTPPTPFQLLTQVIALVCGCAIALAQPPSPEAIREALETKIPEDPATVVAYVGKTPVLAGDILPRVENRVKELIAMAPHDPSPQELQFMRARLFRSLLAQTVQLKMLRESFLLMQVGTQSAEKRQEAEQKMQATAQQTFTDSELPRLYKRFGTKSIDELDAKLREKGGSFESSKREFIDQMLGYLYQSEAVPKDPEVSLADIYNYYQQNKDKYKVKAQVRWEQLTATFEKSGGRDKAIEAINQMGREAYFGGSMQSVAKAKSQEPFAARGGLHEWTNRGSLASTILEEQLFTLPLGVMSEIIEDADSVHIVRILGRREEGFRPLSEAQDEIRNIVKRQKIEEASKRANEEMARRVPVWTLYPDDLDGSLPLPVATTPSNVR
jgi:parvulin-like peptidyl-prolyl isomerase